VVNQTGRTFRGDMALWVHLCVLSVLLLEVTALYQGFANFRFPDPTCTTPLNDTTSYSGENCACSLSAGVCNIKCPGPPPSSSSNLIRQCDPTNNASQPTVVETANYPCSSVLNFFTGGTSNNGNDLKVPGLFTTIGASIGSGKNCSSVRLGDASFRQQLEYELWPYVVEVHGFYDLTIYEIAAGLFDGPDLKNRTNLVTGHVFGNTSQVPAEDFLPEAFAVSLKVGNTSSFWTDFRFSALAVNITASNQPYYTTATYGKSNNMTSYEASTDSYMTAFDFQDWGLNSGERVYGVRVVNLLPSDMVYGGANGLTGWLADTVANPSLCSTHTCFIPQYLKNGSPANYTIDAYDPDIF